MTGPTITLHCGDCLTFMKSMESKSVDLTVTSPPYDNLREYGGHSWDFEGIAQQLFRVTKDGGVVVWGVGDSVVNGSESGTSFVQALYFKGIGFRLHDTMIYWKNCFPFPETNRYAQNFEYMFVFSKGTPTTTNISRVATQAENRIKGRVTGYRQKNGTVKQGGYETGKPERNMENIWTYEVGYGKSAEDLSSHQHPAIFPEQLAKDHIESWSNSGDTIFDPFMGSGTTGVAAKLLRRNFIGCEISKQYFDLAKRRIDSTEWGMFE
jgi:DNA modification methylase